VHLGHKFFNLTGRQSGEKKKTWLSCVITFRQHPRDLLARIQAFIPVYRRRTVQLLKNEGVDIVVALSFNANWPSSAHVNSSACGAGPENARAGHRPDCSLGKNREGNADVLRAWAGNGLQRHVVAPKLINGEVASSTIIRRRWLTATWKK